MKPGFEPVIDQYKKFNKMDQDKRGQLCVYVGDEMIIDVIMDDKKPNPKDAKPFDADSVTTIFSSCVTQTNQLLQS